jgi:uncharacterized integral membrane protein
MAHLRRFQMIRAAASFVVLVLVGLFALLNWQAFAAPTPLSLGFVTVQAPLGLIMLGLFVFACLLFIVWVIALQANALFDARRQTKELAAQRELADRAEASRFTELRNDLLARIDRLQQESRLALDQTGNTITAHLGELEDRFERAQIIATDSPVVYRAPTMR